VGQTVYFFKTRIKKSSSFSVELAISSYAAANIYREWMNLLNSLSDVFRIKSAGQEY
jgi:hypothetical protein